MPKAIPRNEQAKSPAEVVSPFIWFFALKSTDFTLVAIAHSTLANDKTN